MPKLICSICGSERDVPICCEKSMIVRNDLLCCCGDTSCGYQPIPECCDQKMEYFE